VTGRADPTARPRPTRRFAFGLFGYAVLTLFTFWFVWGYTQRIRNAVGGIEDGLQFTIYFLLYAVIALALLVLLRPLRLREETRLRSVFWITATLSAVFALYQAKFGPGLSLGYFGFGVLGAFSALLWATHRRFGLVEVVARPPDDVVAAVATAHADVAPAATTWDRLKRGLELAVALVAIVVSLPISVLLAILVWLQDPGPLLVAKIAVRQGGGSFRQLKLRSMVKQAERATGPVPAAPDDRRVTGLGGLLRRTHIDELPQLVNIARGEMSLVGPRPERTVFVAHHLSVLPRYRFRHAVRPGLAGLAQVYGDYYSTPSEKLRYDLLYIRRRSLALDVSLFGAAVLMALFGRQPGRRHHAREALRQARPRENWRRAYTALRGEPAPSVDPVGPARPASGAGARPTARGAEGSEAAGRLATPGR
jgi:lipopolysaccharide/colanic/teichoic acid biosynthesis glycosyltransferase